MKAQDVVTQLALKLPNFTDAFTDNFSILTLTRVGLIATATTTTAHNLKVGGQVNVGGAQSPITIVSITRIGGVATLVTLTDHDITEAQTAAQNVELSGSTEAEFNGSFVLINVLDRRTITFIIADLGPLAATGTPLLLNGSSYLQSWNGLVAVVSVPSPTQFTYTLVNAPPLNTATGVITARTLPRVSAGVTTERVIKAYTKQGAGKLWAFVIIGDVSASKDRSIDSDAIANIPRNSDYRQQLTHPFTVITIQSATSEIAARAARDIAEDILRPLCQSVLFKTFDSYLAEGGLNPVMFSDHGFLLYDSTVYVHSYAFQASADLTFEDTIGHDADVAFRDIELSMGVDIGNQVLTADINLDTGGAVASLFNAGSGQFQGKAFDISGETNSPTGLFFNPSGTRAYLIENQNRNIYQYDLSVPGDITSAVYNGEFFYVGGQDSDPRDLFIDSTGTRVFVVGNAGNSIRSYTMGTAWDITTMVYDIKVLSVGGIDNSPTGVFFKPNGLNMFFCGLSNDRVYEHTLTIPFDLDTASLAPVSLPISPPFSTVEGVIFRNSGTSMYLVGTTLDAMYQYDLSPSWVLGSATHNGSVLDISPEDTIPRGVFFNAEGSAAYVAGGGSLQIIQYAF